MTPPPVRNNNAPFTFEAMPEREIAHPASILEALLKHPGRIIYELHENRRNALVIWLLLSGLIGMALYGVVVGTLSGGVQLLVAPAKLALGTFFAMLICLPSLYIFACLDGIEARIRTVAGMMFAIVCLTALLLIGFAPVSWIFSQSTDSVALMGALHLLFWIIGIAFGLRLLDAGSRYLGRGERRHLRIWNFIFILVCLQMTTTLRPIIAKSDKFLPGERKFFIANWLDSMAGR